MKILYVEDNEDNIYMLKTSALASGVHRHRRHRRHAGRYYGDL
jgi:hypothetical protein